MTHTYFYLEVTCISHYDETSSMKGFDLAINEPVFREVV